MESKIEATKRLQREGRWEEASAARDREKTRLIDAGMTRREANPAAWAWMIQEYPPITRARIVLNQTLAELPSDPFRDFLSLDVSGNGYRLQDLWWVHRYMVARDQCIKNGDLDGVLEIERCMIDNCPTKHVAVLAALAIASQDRYEAIAEDRFEQAMLSLVDRHTDASDANASYCVMLLDNAMEAIAVSAERPIDDSIDWQGCVETGLFESVYAA